MAKLLHSREKNSTSETGMNIVSVWTHLANIGLEKHHKLCVFSEQAQNNRSMKTFSNDFPVNSEWDWTLGSYNLEVYNSTFNVTK